ncbi:MAG: Uma2 family endonuclease [Cyanobacteria bacterium J06634_6]
MVTKVQWTASDLELMPHDDKRYEIIDGELLVTRAPHLGHQDVCGEIFYYLKVWSKKSDSGKVAITPGVIFTEADNVIPDIVWIEKSRVDSIVDESGHLIEAPDLAIEIISPGVENQRRDRNLKLKLYSAQGVKEYWIADWQQKKIEIYRRTSAQLTLQATLYEGDTITSPLLPDFCCAVDLLFV